MKASDDAPDLRSTVSGSMPAFWEQLVHITLRLKDSHYAVVMVVLSMVSLPAFRRNGYIAVADVWPAAFVPGNHALSEALNLWSSTATSGMGSPSFSPIMVPLGLWGALSHLLGINGPTTEFLFMWMLLIFDGVGTTFFFRTIFPNEPRWAAALAGIGVATSFYSAINFVNEIQPFAMGYFPLVAGFIVRRLRSPVNRLRFSGEIGLLSLGAYVVAASPSLVVYLILWSGLWLILCWFRYRNFKETIAPIIAGLFLSVGANCWWAYAAYITLFKSAAVQQTFASPDAWSWVNQNASLLAQLTMQGHWAWPDPMYYPWAQSYLATVWKYALYVPAVFAFIAALFGRSRKWVFVLAIIGVFSLFIGKGTHAPFSSSNLFLSAKLPFFWLFRDAQVETSKTLYPILFSLGALGIALALRCFLRIAKRFRINKRSLGVLQPTVATMLISVFILGGAPFIDGVFLSDWLGGRAKTVINIPDDWLKASQFINSAKASGRVLLLPNDDFYMMPYRWGYYGTDEVAQTLIKRRVLTLYPQGGGYLSGSTGLSALEQSIEDAIRNRPDLDLSPALEALNIEWIIQRNDVIADLPGRTIISSTYLTRYLDLQRGIYRVREFGNLALYHVRRPASYVEAYDGVGFWMGSHPLQLLEQKLLLGRSIPWLTEDAPGITSTRARAFEVSRKKLSIRNRLNGRMLLSPKTVSVYLKKSSPGSLKVSLIGISLSQSTTRVRWDWSAPIKLKSMLGEFSFLEIGNQRFAVPTAGLNSGRRLVVGVYAFRDSGAGIPIRLWSSRGVDLAQRAKWTPLGDCHNVDPRNAKLQMIGGTTQIVKLSASADAACTEKTIYMEQTSSKPLLLALSYRSLQGHQPELVLSEDGGPYEHIELSPGHAWLRLRHWLTMRPHRRVAVTVYAYGQRGLPRTINEYGNVKLVKMQVAGEIRARLSSSVVPVRAGQLVFEPAYVGKNLIAGWGKPFNANAYEPLPDFETRLRFHKLASHVIDLSAKREGVGITQSIWGVGSRLLHISLSARGVKGSAPVARVSAQDGTQLFVSAFTNSTSWQDEESDILVPMNNDYVSISLYAYAGNDHLTETQYKNVTLAAAGGGAGLAVQVSGAPPRKIPMPVNETRTNEFVATPAASAKILVFKMSFDRQWAVLSRGHLLPWRHVIVDGATNGWLITGEVPSSVTIAYLPALWSSRLQLLACVTVLLSLLLFARSLGLQRAKQQQTISDPP